MIEHELGKRSTEVPGWYVSPEIQIADMEDWNHERSWGFKDRDFPNYIPDFVPRTPFEALVLTPYLPELKKGHKLIPGFVRTADELWHIARSFQPGWWLWDFQIHADYMRLLAGTEDAHVPGIRWTAVDLGANWNQQDGARPYDVRGANSAHAEILAAMAHFPGWIQAMDGEEVPYVWFPGYQVTIPGSGRGNWPDVPVFDTSPSDGVAYLGARWGGHHDKHYAVPEFREL